MTDSAPAADAAPANTPAIADSGDELSVEEAMSLYAQSEPKLPDDGEGAEDPAAAEVERELASKEADSAPEKDPAEETQADEPDNSEEELPPIDPPRSWTKEEKAEFLTYPRAAQEKIAAREQERETALRRSQNEAADIRKAAETERTKAEESRKAYEAKQAAYTKALEDALQNEFGDIQSMADVRKMQAEDPFRYQQWDLRQKELAYAQAEKSAVDQKNAQDKRDAWAKFVQAESEAFSSETPAFKAKEAEYTKKAGEVLTELGFTNEELAKLASGEDKIALYDRRLQRLLFDRIQLSEIKAAPAKAAPKQLPPVQRPGAAKPQGAQNAASIQALTRKLESSGSVDDAFELFLANQRRAS